MNNSHLTTNVSAAFSRIVRYVGPVLEFHKIRTCQWCETCNKTVLSAVVQCLLWSHWSFNDLYCVRWDVKPYSLTLVIFWQYCSWFAHT